MSGRIWDGREWQDYCLLLLRKRYEDHSLQEMPDRHGGDLGIEAFSLDGCAFQCYAALEPLSTNELYESQRDKLTADLSKLSKYEDELKKVFGSLKISKYVFMVHRLDSKRLIEHATTKAAQIVALQLDFISDDFRIIVVTDDQYAKERDFIVALPEQLIQPDEVTPEGYESWTLDNSSLMEDAERKLKKIGLSGDGLSQALESIAYSYLESENALTKLRANFPDHWNAAKSSRSRKERRLPMEFPAHENSSMTVVPAVVEALAKDLARDAPSLTGSVADLIAWGTVSDWLMRCPLDFKAST